MTLRRVGRAAFRAAQTVALFPLVVVSWILLRIAWLIRLAASGVWRLVIGTARLVWSGFAAIGLGIRDAVVGACVFAGTLVARSVSALVAMLASLARHVRMVFAAIGRGLRDAVVGVISLLVGAVTAIARAAREVVYASGRAVARAAAVGREAIVASGRAVVGACVFAGTLVARSVSALVAMLASLARHARMAFAAVARAAREMVYASGRRVARGAAVGRDAIVASGRAVVGACVFAGTLIARSTTALVAMLMSLARRVRAVFAAIAPAARDVVYATGRRVARGAAEGRDAIVASGRAVVRASAFAGTLIARSTTALVAMLMSLARRVRAVFAAIAPAARDVVYASGRGGARGADVGRHAIVSGGRAVVRASAFAGTLVARSTTALVALTGAMLVGRWSAITGLSDRGVARLWSLTSHARGAGDRLAHALHSGRSPMIRLVVPRMPLQARQVRMVPVLVIVLAVTAGGSFGVIQLMPAPALTVPLQLATAVPVQAAAALPALEPPPPKPRAAVQRTSSAATTVSTARPNVTRSLSPARVRDLWSKTDTRSLDRALTSLRSATLAFQRCEMRLTSGDRAVAHCDEAGTGAHGGAPVRVAWTIDFRRDDGRWLIDGVSSGKAQGLTGGLP